MKCRYSAWHTHTHSKREGRERGEQKIYLGWEKGNVPLTTIERAIADIYLFSRKLIRSCNIFARRGSFLLYFLMNIWMRKLFQQRSSRFAFDELMDELLFFSSFIFFPLFPAYLLFYTFLHLLRRSEECAFATWSRPDSMSVCLFSLWSYLRNNIVVLLDMQTDWNVVLEMHTIVSWQRATYPNFFPVFPFSIANFARTHTQTTKTNSFEYMIINRFTAI